MTTPEARARHNIDAQLAACGWLVQDRAALNLHAGLGMAVREFPLETGVADYLLFVDRKAAGVIEAKAEGATLSGVSEQAGAYAVGLPSNLPDPDVLAQEIIQDLQAALEQFTGISEDLTET